MGLGSNCGAKMRLSAPSRFLLEGSIPERGRSSRSPMTDARRSSPRSTCSLRRRLVMALLAAIEVVLYNMLERFYPCFRATNTHSYRAARRSTQAARPEHIWIKHKLGR